MSLNKERAKENQPKGLMPFGNPEREKSFRYRFTHFFARSYSFSCCERDLKKVTLTKDARKRDSKSLCHLLRTLVQLIFKQSRSCCSLACRSWWQGGERCIKSNMSFSSILSVERHGKGGPGGNVRADFLLSFLCSVTKKGHQNPHSERVPKAQGERQKEKLLEAPTKNRPRITLAA